MMDRDTQRNTIIAVVLSMLVIVGYHLLFEQPRLERAAEVQRQQQLAQAAEANRTALNQGDGQGEGQAGETDTGSFETALTGGDADSQGDGETAVEARRLEILTERLSGSINLRGARLDDLELVGSGGPEAGYVETVNGDDPVVLLQPRGSDRPYYVDVGWLAGSDGVAVPGSDSVWQSESEQMSEGQPVTMTWSNGGSLDFERQMAVDENYMFTVTDRVTNTSDQPIALYPYGRVVRRYTPDLAGFFILHEGPIGVFSGELEEFDYEDLLEPDFSFHAPVGSGWLGLTDKYWLVALVPGEEIGATGRMVDGRGGNQQPGSPVYQADYTGREMIVQPGETLEVSSRVFAGAKEVDLLDGYGDTLGINNLYLAVDFGWFYFLTIPFFHLLHFLGTTLGNVGLGILAATVLVKLAMFPLANKAFFSMNRMKALQPEMEKLRKRHKDNPQDMQKSLMELYRKEKVNPVSGCLPIILQIPVFFSLYKVLFVTIEMRHEPFFGWVQDLSAPDPTNIFTLFGVLPFDPLFGIYAMGLWPLLMGATMFLQTRLNPLPPDPMQARIMTLLPLVFTFLLASFPAGLVIYWAWNNTLSILQQLWLKRKMARREQKEKAEALARKGKASLAK